MSIEKLRIWLSYFLILPGLGRQGNPVEADCLIAYSFSRNTFKDNELDKVRKMFEDYHHSSINTILRLRELKFDSGKANIFLAKECQRLVEKYHLFAIVQWEIAAVFDLGWYRRFSNNIYIVWPSRDKYLSTFVLSDKAARIMHLHQLSRPLIVAHKMHAARCYIGLRSLIGHDPITIRSKVSHFDKKSVQRQTTNLFFWLLHEIAARIVTLFLIKILIKKRN